METEDTCSRDILFHLLASIASVVSLHYKLFSTLIAYITYRFFVCFDAACLCVGHGERQRETTTDHFTRGESISLHTLPLQGSYGTEKTWKVMEFHKFNFSGLESQNFSMGHGKSWKVTQNDISEDNKARNTSNK